MIDRDKITARSMEKSSKNSGHVNGKGISKSQEDDIGISKVLIYRRDDTSCTNFYKSKQDNNYNKSTLKLQRNKEILIEEE